jgi:hypothetical protein
MGNQQLEDGKYTGQCEGSEMISTEKDIKVLDEVFIATALLHREQPDRQDFTIIEIVERASRENLFGRLRPGVRAYASSHCVANRPPSPNKYGTLYATGERTRRLLLAGDDVHPGRTSNPFPDPEDVPQQYRELIEWARKRYGKGTPKPVRWLDGVFQTIGTGKDVWKGEDPDEYVRKLRKGWA